MYLKKELYGLLRTDERIFDFIQDSSLDGLWYWDLENPENEWMNARFWTVLGYHPDEMPHKSSAWQSIINQDDLKVANENFVKHCEDSNYPYDQLVRYTHKDGSTKWIHCRGLAIRDSAGKPIRMLGAHQDVTELKRSEQELHKVKEKAEESEARFSALFTSMSEMVVLHELVFNEDGKPINYRITDCNNAFTKITGITRKNAIGRLSTEVYGTEQPPYLNEFSMVALSGESYHYETYFQPMDKHFSVSVISPEKNQFATVTTDITKHKQAEETLRESEQNLSITLHSIGDGVITTDNFGMIDRMNPVALKLCGWHEDEIKGRPLTEVFNIIDAHTRKPVPNPVEKVMENGEVVGLANHTALVAKNGKEYQIADSAAPIKDKDGNIKGVVLVFSDVSEKYAAEQQIIKAKEKAEESEKKYRLLTEFAADVVWVLNLTTEKFAYISPSIFQLRGLTVEEAMNETLEDAMTPESLKIVKDTITKHTKYFIEHPEANNYYINEIQQTCKNGQIIWAEVSTKFRYSPTGDIEVVGVSRNIDERKQAEEELKTGNRIFKHSLDMLCIAGFDGYFKVLNPSWTKILGWSKEELLSKPWIVFVHPDDRDDTTDIKTVIVDGKEIYQFENRYMCKDGTIKWLSWNSFPYPEENIMFGVARDVTVSKQRELTINNFFEQPLNINLITDYGGKINRANSGWEIYLGYQKDEIIGNNFFDFIHPDDISITVEEMKKLEKGISTLHFENRYRHKNGEYRKLEWSAIPSSDEHLIYAVAIDITERKLAEEKIREKDIQFQKLSSNLPDLIYQFTRRPDGSYCVPIASEGIKNIFGCSPEDVLEDFTPIGRVIHPEDAERVINDIEYSAKHLSYFTCEFRVHIPGKPVQWILSRSTPEKLPDGSVTWYGFNANITERKQTEEELYKSNQRLESLLEISQNITSTIDQDEIMQMIVDNAIRLMEADTGAIYLKNDDETISLSATTPELPNNFPDDLRNAYLKNHPHLNKALRTGKHVLMEDALFAKLTSEEKKIVDLRKLRTILYEPIMLRNKTIGALLLSSVEATRIFTHNDLKMLQAFANQAAHIIDNVNNYTRTKQSEIQLRKLSQAVEQSPAIVMITNLNGDIEYVNPMFSEVTGYTFEEATGQNPKILKSGEQPAEVYKELWETITAGEIWKGEFHNKKKNGDLFWEAASISSITNSEGKITHFLAVKEDITKKKLIEQDLIKAKEKAEESDRLKSAFLANMSHEIRTPMNGILGFAGLLKEPDLTGDEQQQYIEIIQKSGARMLNIINDIVSISKIESGIIDIQLTETNINNQLQFVYDSLILDAENKKLKLSYNCEFTDKEAIIITDKEKFYEILSNLTKNAIKYTKEGVIELGYKIVETRHASSLQFYVKDTGIGIPKDRQEAIFERFIQADIADKMAYQGAGLGLAISKAYVEMLGGKIWVESEEGIGSTFYFTLPYNAKPVKETIVQQHEPFGKNETIRKLKILIAEDDEVSEMLLDETVKTFSKEILNARTGVEAVEVCRNNPDIDLILMDIRMPDMGGYKATRQIREFNKEVIIIAQTAYGLSGDREKAIKAGCTDYIAKPINKDELLALIQKYFEK